MSESKWIKVKERRPETAVDVLFTDGENVFLGWMETLYKEEDPIWWANTGHFSENPQPEGITHWMSLPKPPKPPKDSDET